MSERRLHPAGIAIYGVQALGNAIFPLIVVLGITLAGGHGSDVGGSLLWGLGFIAIGLVSGYVKWATTYFSVDERAIHHREGILRVERTDVPLARVEALDVHQGVLQRLFGVQSVLVQTGGGGKGGEVTLPAVSADTVRELRARVGVPEPSALDPGRRLRLGLGGLLVTALTAGQLGVVVPVIAGGFQVVQQVFQDEGSRNAVDALPDTTHAWVLLALIVIGAAWALSILGSIVAFAGFSAARDGSRVRIRRGLLARREATIPVGRVRAVRVVEGVFRRPFGLAALHVEVTGYADEASAARTLFPLLRRERIGAALELLLPELADEIGALARPPRRAYRRYVFKPGLVAAALAAAAIVALRSPWPALVPAAGLAYGHARWRDAGWRLDGGRLAIRSLRMARTTVLAPARNRESHELAQSVWQRRAALGDLRFDFGKKTRAKIRHLDFADATAAWQSLSGR
jgi:putative membrane protein